MSPALIRRPSRFDRKWVIRDPDEDTRRWLLKLCFRDDISDVIVQEIAARTDDWSAAYLKELFITAGFISMRDLAAEVMAETSDGIEPEHIRRAFEMLDSQRTLEKRNFNPAASLGSPPRVWGQCNIQLWSIDVTGSPPRVWGQWKTRHRRTRCQENIDHRK